MITNENKTRKKEFELNYLKFWLKLFSFRNKLKTWDIDFNKPWWYIFWQHKFLILPTFITESIQSIFWVCLPIILVYSFDSKQYFWLISALIFRIILVPIVWLIYHNWVRFVEILEGSIWISTGKYFLTVDPIYHTTQSSGQMVSKINRAAQGYFDLVTLISGK